MKVAEQNNLRERIYKMLGQRSKHDVLHHFLAENVSRSTIYAIFARYNSGVPPVGIKKPGRKPILNKTKLKKLVGAAKDHLGASNRALSRKFKVSKETIRQNLIKMGVIYHNRVTVPRYTNKQLNEIPKRCRSLRRNYLKKNMTLILDDEKYFTFAWSSGDQNAGFYTDDIKNTPENVRFAAKCKFESKVLVWCAISVRGISRLYIQDSKAPAINCDTYINKCLTLLKRFIDEKHANDNIIFWPDLASSHYARKTTDWLKDKNIPFVPKKVNPPNIPKARPIEDFWSLLCQQVYKNGWSAQSTDQLIKRIRFCVKKVDMTIVQEMIKGVKGKLRKIEDNGPLSLYKKEK